MSFNFAEAKLLVRQTVHETLGVPAFYQDDVVTTPVPVSARWINKTRLIGDNDGEGYARTEEPIDKIVLGAGDSAALGCKRGGTITFENGGMVFLLHERLPNDGPYDETWLVSRQ